MLSAVWAIIFRSTCSSGLIFTIILGHESSLFNEFAIDDEPPGLQAGVCLPNKQNHAEEGSCGKSAAQSALMALALALKFPFLGDVANAFPIRL